MRDEREKILKDNEEHLAKGEESFESDEEEEMGDNSSEDEEEYHKTLKKLKKFHD